jgi:hypothetical protein
LIKSKVLNPHTGRQQQILKCKLCKYQTQKSSNMMSHINVHYNKKTYECIGCKNLFG